MQGLNSKVILYHVIPPLGAETKNLLIKGTLDVVS